MSLQNHPLMHRPFAEQAVATESHALEVMRKFSEQYAKRCAEEIDSDNMATTSDTASSPFQEQHRFLRR